MFTFTIILIGVIGVVMVLAILLQSGKGGGLAGIAAGGTQQILGTRSAPDILEKATWILGSSFIVLCVLSNFLIDRGETTRSVIQEGAQGQTTTAPAIPPIDQAPPPSQTPPPDNNN